ncbi:MAG: ABC transporter ATP-binding protein [Verrucomicrobia bacterium]|nr:ABC transporter ATP-binding protein [Verrucomicrobiota bacterium]
MSRAVVLSVKDLKKIYPGKIPFIAVGGISFDLKEGEILGLLGSNGAGKTTTIQMLLSTLKSTSGSIEYFGKDLSTHRSEVLKHVAFASTYVSLPWQLTVEQNLEVFGRLYGLSAEERRERTGPLLERFGIASKLKSYVSKLSAGQITRLMLVKAFMIRPKVALLDEPTASLDPDIARDVIEFVFEQREKFGTSILYTSHNMAEVAEVCDRVLFLKQGKIVADDIPENLAKSVSTSRIQLQVGDGMKRTAAVAERLKLKYKIEHRTIELELDESQIAALLSALAEAGVIYTNINILQPTLEDYFLHMVGKGAKS